MSSWERAIEEGVAEGMALGFQNAVAKVCDGYDDPEDRCPMKPPYCACMCVRYRALPWWRKIFTEKPPAPTNNDCLGACIRSQIGIV